MLMNQNTTLPPLRTAGRHANAWAGVCALRRCGASGAVLPPPNRGVPL